MNHLLKFNENKGLTEDDILTFFAHSIDMCKSEI